jgi:hypothetical protein
VKCGSVRKCRRKFNCKLPGNTLPSIRYIHNPINKVGSAGSLLDKKPAKMCCALTEEKLDKIGAT